MLDPRDLDDIQGVILRGYRRMGHARHLLLKVEQLEAFKVFLGNLATEEDRDSGPFVTVASDWFEKPPAKKHPVHALNIGLTYSGLRALGLAEQTLNRFPSDFSDGAVARAKKVGDTGASAPEHWIEALRPEHHADVHAVLSLYAISEPHLGKLAEDVLTRAAGAATVLADRDANVLYKDAKRAGTVHFGYRDGLSQPTIAGVPKPPSATEHEAIRDPLGEVPLGDFVLGHDSSYNGHLPEPGDDAFGRNGSFAAFRIIEQDVQAFEAFIEGPDGKPDELLAARMCGRWRESGVPLVMSPNSDTADIPESELNGFDFAGEHPDPHGSRCPLGSHIRRANPRRQPGTPGDDAGKRRIIRRGLPYGSLYRREEPDDEERGLIGMFICASLRDQYEMMMRLWINDGAVAGGLGRTRDPLCGNIAPTDAPFVAPGDPDIEVTGLPRFCTTRGGAYLFLPSMTALRRLAAGA